jgi:hypothetical protein
MLNGTAVGASGAPDRYVPTNNVVTLLAIL